ncbi:glycosyl hydrolase family 8 [Roseateles asaccharophilus]|uniref:cellulase n=1 Tax=Roseateles asaccharophilus TaxID=582607 RepID=A0ABU2A212_9BURK|nr:glycosyl hydrolase family 8 [Roseateles asaccharophilus]MDR7331234.1 endo-1,4-beta-D-glucanase Y [Roseateles asaccharophilus]
MLSRFKRLVLGLGLMSAGAAALACNTPASICARDAGQGFGLVRAGQPAAVLVDAGADPALQHVSRSFAADLQRVSGREAALLKGAAGAPRELVLIAEQGRSPLLDDLARRGKLKAADLKDFKGQWEAFRQIVVDKPFPGVERALVIVGSDRRGAVFGAYDLSARIGVSPWHFWADVPVEKKADLFVTAGTREDKPAVKYRGIFINDEAPALSTWAEKKFGGANAKMYAHVFELLLRLKGNYLWPAMWPPRAFYADDPRNGVLADEMGVVMGASHHEPMTRAHDEWQRFKGGHWDYAKNAPHLREFWRGGIQRMMGRPDGSAFDTLVTVGMRGDGDEPMSEETATTLLETIVKDQRQIIADVTKQPTEKTPQMWALYKEVQDYYDKGMKVPDDVLLLFADDNWGQIRRLPEPGAKRPGGYGVYYHFDYVGGPRNYKWLNTNQIEKTWQQMDLAREHGADALWIVNVGDIKPVEFPIHFFLDMAWAPKAMTADALKAYPKDWAATTFGAAHAAEIGELVTRYSQYAARRKPELVDANSFRLGLVTANSLAGGDFGDRIAEWDALEARVAKVKAALRPDQLDAYFQLVEHPVIALANLYRLYYAVAWNRTLAAKNDPRANVFADQAEAAFKRDQAISDQYHAIAGGKWDGMMLQVHIGYTTWQQPAKNIMPAVTRVTGTADAAAVLAQLKPFRHTGPNEPRVIEATQFVRTHNAKGLAWTAIPNLGQSAGAVMALPQGRGATTVADDVRVEYEVETQGANSWTLQLHMVPTIDVRKAGCIRIAVAIGDQQPQTLTLNLIPTAGAANTQAEKDWSRAVINNEFVLRGPAVTLPAGKHRIRVWRLDDNAVVQKLVLQSGIVSSAPVVKAAAQTGQYRNLLRELRSDITEADIDKKLATYWKSLFEGGKDQRIVFPAAATPDGPASYVLDVGNNDVRSEGMSYGMMLAVQMGRKAEFNAIWNWTWTHMRYRSGPRQSYFRWQCKPEGCQGFGKDAVPASDGEEYFATALLMAASRWGNGQGVYDYNAQAQEILTAMLHKETMNGGIKDGARSMFSPKHGQVVFVPVGDAAEFSDPSYHLPAFYEIWARRAAKPEDRKRWSEIADISRAYFNKAAHPHTGLTPDYAHFDGRPKVLEGHEDFRYDAFRTAVNWSVDQAWWGKNPSAIGLSHKLLNFFAGQKQQPYVHLFTLDGKPLHDEPSKGLISCNAVAALLVDEAQAAPFVNAFWALDPPTGQWRYYDGLLQFMNLLHITGRFKAW